MEILNQMVELMSRKEVKNFKIYTNRMFEGNDKDRKDMRLFDMIRKNPQGFIDDFAFKKLYNSKDKNAYYRLKNRLTDDINKSLFLQNYRESDTVYTLYLLALGYSYYEKGQYQISHRFFKKAEKKAVSIENYSLLDAIYTRLIYTSREILTGESPEFYIKKRKENRETLLKMSEIEDILEAVEYRMKITQNLSTTAHVTGLLKIAIKDFANNNELIESPRLQLGIYLVVSRALLQRKDYTSLEAYLSETYKTFEKNKIFNKPNHSHKLQMLSWIANALFMNRKFKESLKCAAILKQEMEQYDGFLFERYEFFYINTLVINYSEINPDKAIEILTGLCAKEQMEKINFNGVFVYLNLAVLYYHKNNYNSALKHLNMLYQLDVFKNTDSIFQLRIYLGELIMQYELHEFNVLEYRYRQLQKQYLSEDNKNTGWEIELLELFTLIILGKKILKEEPFRKSAMHLIEIFKNTTTKDDMLFGYDAWLKKLLRIS